MAPATLSYVLRWVQQKSYRHYCLGEDKWTMNGFPIPYCTKWLPNFQAISAIKRPVASTLEFVKDRILKNLRGGKNK